jgi:pimeloyl-ACP methyl ester carboxylesterase
MPHKIINGIDLNYVDQGTGPAIVLVHGYPLDARMWEDQVRALSVRHRIIAPDLRGFGRTTTQTPFTIESLADDVHSLVQALGAGPCILGGFSMGGYVALASARKYPSAMQGLMLIDTRAEADTPEGQQKRDKMIELVRAQGSSAIAEQMLPNMLAPRTKQNRPELVARVRSMMESCPSTTIEHALRALRDRPDFSDLLGSIVVPTLLLVGEQDGITPPALSINMSRAIPRASLEIIPDAGHLAPMEQPDRVAHEIEQFAMALA